MRRPKINGAQPLEVAPTLEDIERFLSKCRQDGEHWLWTGRLDENGYGRFDYANTNVGAHRFAYALFQGALPKSKQVHHDHESCSLHSCVNPQHLRVLTGKRNSVEAARHKRKAPPIPF